MKHHLQAKADALLTLGDPVLLAGVQKACLIVDVYGKLHVLALLEDAEPATPKEATMKEALAVAAEGYWSGELFLQRGKDHADGRSKLSDEPLFNAVWDEAVPEPPSQEKLFVLQRRFSKESWFDPALQPPWPLHPKTPRIVSFYSYKGGVGRTTALAAVALQLARQGERVAVLDFDLEAPGLGSVFPPPSGVPPELGLLDYFVEYPVLGAGFPLADIFYAYADAKAIGTGEPIQVCWSGQVAETYLEKLSRLNLSRLTAAPAQGEAPEIKALLSFTKKQHMPDWILIDSRAGLHDLGGLALSGLAHWHVLCGLDSEQSWAGLRMAVVRLGRTALIAGQCQKECLLIQAMVQPGTVGVDSMKRFLSRSHEIFSEEYYVKAEDDPDGKFYELPDRDATDQPHFPVTLAHDNQVMAYQSAADVAERLCEGDFRRLAETLIARVSEALPP